MHLCHAKECRVVELIQSQAFFIELEGLLKVLLAVSHLAQNKLEVGLEQIQIGSDRCVVLVCLLLDSEVFNAELAQIPGDAVLALEEVVVG